MPALSRPDEIQMKTSSSKLIRLTIVAVFTALVFVATMIFQIPIPATGGYFNLGEAVIYAAALIFGAFVGAFSGGVGAALSDVITGYPIFAPGTLIIKFTEGAIVGYLGGKVPFKKASMTFWRILSILLGTTLGLATYYIGTSYMGISGNTHVDEIVWAGIAIFLAASIVFTSFVLGATADWHAIAIILGGTTMIAGYFLYESLLATLFPGLKIFAAGEIPLNIGQMLVGMTIALPVTGYMRKTLPYDQKIL